MTTRREMFLSTLAAAFRLRPRSRRGRRREPGQGPCEKTAHDHAHWMGDETIAMLLYPKFTALDLFGPQHMFGSLMGAKVLLVAETADPVPSHSGVKVVPTTTFADCPEKLSILFGPGGLRGDPGGRGEPGRPTLRQVSRREGRVGESVAPGRSS